MRTSTEWLRYYEHNARSLLEIPWHLPPDHLTPDELSAIASSLQTFQAGERSEGNHLYKYAQAYSARTGDADYVPAIRLFIAEEQRHARDLGRFLTLHSVPLLETTFTNRVFRRLRNLVPGLECSVAVLITAELIALVYYDAIRSATNSPTLRRLCDQILSDEVAHVVFQSDQLRKLREGHSVVRLLATQFMQRFLFFGTVLVVYASHRRPLRRGAHRFGRWWVRCWEEFNAAFAGEVRRVEVPSLGTHPIPAKV
jgi:hypothetical protein